MDIPEFGPPGLNDRRYLPNGKSYGANGGDEWTEFMSVMTRPASLPRFRRYRR
jgi:hypothetical protein